MNQRLQGQQERICHLAHPWGYLHGEGAAYCGGKDYQKTNKKY